MNNQEIQKMLTKSVEVCTEHGKRSTHDAYRVFLDYLGKRVNLHKEPLQIDEKILDGVFDMNLLRSEIGDHLGPLIMTLEIGNTRAGQFMTPTTVTEMMVQMNNVAEMKSGQNILDPSCGTGGMLLTSLKYIVPGVGLMGIDIDTTMCRSSFVQLAIYANKNPFYILCANALTEYPPDWSKANKW